MFDSITHWFDSLQQQSRLFDHADDEILHGALASLLYHVISADNHLDVREKREFTRIMQAEFDLNDDQVEHLYQVAKSSTNDIKSDLHTINRYLKRNPALRMIFMRKLLQLIDVDGVQPPQLDIFYAALHEVFPEVRELGSEEDL
jgi:uncharacterized tellurite resistance protein B-like protein